MSINNNKIIEDFEKSIQENSRYFAAFVGDRNWIKQIPPDKSDKPIGGRLEDWYVSNSVVNGFIYDDPRNYFSQGALIHTSYIVDLNIEEDYLETRNTIYILGKPKNNTEKNKQKENTMSIENLISYPVVPLFNDAFINAFMDDKVSGETLFEYGVDQNIRSTISVRLLQESADPVFVVGEALQSGEDSFNKKVGKAIADGRAKTRKELDEDINWTTFSLSEALNTVDDVFERKEKGEVIKVSSVTLPLSGLPLPHGVVNRLKMLIERKD